MAGLFADDAVVEDPVGPSLFDPEGKGHRGREAITAFYDNVIMMSEKIEFTIRDSYECGSEVANVGQIRITLPGDQVGIVPIVNIYRVNDAGEARRPAFVLGGRQADVQPGVGRARPRAPTAAKRPTTRCQTSGPGGGGDGGGDDGGDDGGRRPPVGRPSGLVYSGLPPAIVQMLTGPRTEVDRPG